MHSLGIEIRIAVENRFGGLAAIEAPGDRVHAEAHFPDAGGLAEDLGIADDDVICADGFA